MTQIGAIGIVLAAFAAAAAILFYPRLRARFRRPPALTSGERDRLFTLLPWRDQLSPRQRDRLAAAAAQILDAVRFVGCGGLAVTADMHLVVAGQAGMLCLGPRASVFELPREILLYPDAFYIPQTDPDELGLVDDRPFAASGEAWDSGRVVLSWADAAAALAGAQHNVVLHEFAHLLDFAAPRLDGVPPGAGNTDGSPVLEAAFEQLRAQGSPVLDVYGAENRAEFFAVAVETFFQRGAALAAAHPPVYRLLADYFAIDTAAGAPAFAQVPEITPR